MIDFDFMAWGVQVISAFHQYWGSRNQFPIKWTITIFFCSETKSPNNLLITFYFGFIWFLHTIFSIHFMAFGSLWCNLFHFSTPFFHAVEMWEVPHLLSLQWCMIPTNFDSSNNFDSREIQRCAKLRLCFGFLTSSFLPMFDISQYKPLSVILSSVKLPWYAYTALSVVQQGVDR